MKRLPRLLALALGLALTAQPAPAQLWGQGADDPTGGPTATRLPAALPDASYSFHPTSTTVTRSRHFDLAKDTPSFVNAGQVNSPGGTCYGIAYMTQYWYEKVVYRFLGLGEAVAEPDLGVPSIRSGDSPTFESKRVKAFTGTRAGRDRFQRLATSAHRNHRGWGNGLSRGAEDSHDEWIGNVGNAAQGLGFMWFQANDDAWSHAVLIGSAQEGQARVDGASSGPRVTKFRIVDSNRLYNAAGDHDTDYVMYFHDAERAGVSSQYNALYGNNAQSGAFLDENKVGYYSPYGWMARATATCEDTTQGADIQWGGVSSGSKKVNQAADPECAPEEESW